MPLMEYLQNEAGKSRIPGMLGNRPHSEYDPAMGYRWKRGGHRLVRFYEEELVYDNNFFANNYGYHAHFDYQRRKPDARTYRIIVYGDSFTNCAYMPVAWPEHLQRLLNSRPDTGRQVQVYGCPIDGGGLYNWYNLFKSQTLPEFEFDCLLIADWLEDLGRKYIITHCTEEYRYIWRKDIDERPLTSEAFMQRFSECQPLYRNVSDAYIEERIAESRQKAPANPGVQDYYLKLKSPEVVPENYEFSPQTFTARYGAKRWQMLQEIVSACRDRNIRVIYSPLPAREDLLHAMINGAQLFHPEQGRQMSAHLGMDFFNGYEMFYSLDPEDLCRYYWLKYDGHWGVAAADLYVLRLGQWLLKQRIIAPLP